MIEFMMEYHGRLFLSLYIMTYATAGYYFKFIYDSDFPPGWTPWNSWRIALFWLPGTLYTLLMVTLDKFFCDVDSSKGD